MQQHYHIHYGDPDELDDDDSLALSIEPTPSLEQTLDEIHDFLMVQRSLVASDSVSSLTAYRTVSDYLNLLANMSDEHVQVIESVGLELEIVEGLAVSIVPCDLDCGKGSNGKVLPMA